MGPSITTLTEVTAIAELLVSSVHSYVGRPDATVCSAEAELVSEVSVRAGFGVVGDRYFNQRAHRDAAITVMSCGSLAPWPGVGLLQTRRTILLDGVDVDAAEAGTVLVLDCGSGPVRLQINRPANPCRWMDTAVGAGAWRALRGRGGMRCTPLSDGRLRVGPIRVSWLT